MEQSKVRRQRTAQEWETILAEQVSSGLSQTAYCRRHGITLSGFYNAKSRIKSKSVLAPVGAAAKFIGISLDAILPPAPAPAPWDVELSLGEGVVLRIRGSGRL